jgi:4-phosphopantoate--beta-alanine ligase
MIPPDHPRYRSLVARERIAECARSGVVSLEGIAAH